MVDSHQVILHDNLRRIPVREPRRFMCCMLYICTRSKDDGLTDAQCGGHLKVLVFLTGVGYIVYQTFWMQLLLYITR